MELPPEFELVTTADGSPSLAFTRADGYLEQMHHRAGALTESLYVYGEALDRARSLDATGVVLSVGLGLGYNELITIARLDRAARACRLVSTEASAFLREAFVAWATGGAGALAATLDDVAARAGTSRRAVARWLDEGRLELRGDFPAEVADLAGVGLVYFDAYSNKMDPHLWDEDVLVGLFERILAPTCVLATYAATGALNRVCRRVGLRDCGKAGFAGKRQSTLAIRLAPAPAP